MAAANTPEGLQELSGCGRAQSRKHFCTAVRKSDSLWSWLCTNEYSRKPKSVKVSISWLGPHTRCLSEVHLLKQRRKLIKTLQCANLSLLAVLISEKTLLIHNHIMLVARSIMGQSHVNRKMRSYGAVFAQVFFLFLQFWGSVCQVKL